MKYLSIAFLSILFLSGCEKTTFSAGKAKIPNSQSADGTPAGNTTVEETKTENTTVVVSGSGDEIPKAQYTIQELLVGFSTAVPADILFVIDNSRSMKVHQDAVKDNMTSFMGKFSQLPGLDWKMGLLSSDIGDAPKAGFTTPLIDSQHSNAARDFGEAVDALGDWGDSNEKFFDPVKNALIAYPNFLRSSANFDLVFITDTDDQSSQTPPVFFNWLKGHLGGSKKMKLFGVFNPPEWGCVQTDKISNGFTYVDFVWSWPTSKHLGLINAGLPANTYKLCDPKFGDQLLQIADDLVFNSAQVGIPLPTNVNESTLVVKYKDAALVKGTQYSYDAASHKITFPNLNFANDVNIEIKIYYQTI